MREREEHYFSEDPQSELRVKAVKIRLKNGHEYTFRSPSGVFAFGKSNRATECFLENLCIRGKDVLDLGCGYGVVGIVSAKENPFINLYMSDINKRAVNFAKENSLNYNLKVEVRAGNLFEPWAEEKFDTVLFNPPMAAGKNLWMKALEDSYDHIRSKGTLQIVAYHNKGGKRIMEYMREIFSNVKTLVRSGGIRVYLSERQE